MKRSIDFDAILCREGPEKIQNFHLKKEGKRQMKPMLHSGVVFPSKQAAFEGKIRLVFLRNRLAMISREEKKYIFINI